MFSEAVGAEPPCFISLSLVPTWRPDMVRALFSVPGRVMTYPDQLLRRVLGEVRTIACGGKTEHAYEAKLPSNWFIDL